MQSAPPPEEPKNELQSEQKSEQKLEQKSESSSEKKSEQTAYIIGDGPGAYFAALMLKQKGMKNVVVIGERFGKFTRSAGLSQRVFKRIRKMLRLPIRLTASAHIKDIERGLYAAARQQDITFITGKFINFNNQQLIVNQKVGETLQMSTQDNDIIMDCTGTSRSVLKNVNENNEERPPFETEILQSNSFQSYCSIRAYQTPEILKVKNEYYNAHEEYNPVSYVLAIEALRKLGWESYALPICESYRQENSKCHIIFQIPEMKEDKSKEEKEKRGIEVAKILIKCFRGNPNDHSTPIINLLKNSRKHPGKPVISIFKVIPTITTPSHHENISHHFDATLPISFITGRSFDNGMKRFGKLAEAMIVKDGEVTIDWEKYDAAVAPLLAEHKDLALHAAKLHIHNAPDTRAIYLDAYKACIDPAHKNACNNPWYKEIIKSGLISIGIEPPNSPEIKWTPLHHAIMQADLVNTREILDTDNTNVFTVSGSDGLTPIDMLRWSPDKEYVSQLLYHPASINFLKGIPLEETPLRFAIKWEFPEAILLSMLQKNENSPEDGRELLAHAIKNNFNKETIKAIKNQLQKGVLPPQLKESDQKEMKNNDGFLLNKKDIALVDAIRYFLAGKPSLKQIVAFKKEHKVNFEMDKDNVLTKIFKGQDGPKHSVIFTGEKYPNDAFILYEGKEQKLGEGRFARTKIGQNYNSGELVAVKIAEPAKLINNKQDEKENKLKIEGSTLRMQMDLLKVKSKDEFKALLKRSSGEEESNEMLGKSYLVQHLYSGSEAKKIVPELSINEFLFLVLSSAEELIALHERDIIHRDISLGNFVFDKNLFTSGLVDMGFAMKLEPGQKFIPNDGNITSATPAPEIETKGYSKGSDIYAFADMISNVIKYFDQVFKEQLPNDSRVNLYNLTATVEKLKTLAPDERESRFKELLPNIRALLISLPEKFNQVIISDFPKHNEELEKLRAEWQAKLIGSGDADTYTGPAIKPPSLLS